jgi:hypothetical protein
VKRTAVVIVMVLGAVLAPGAAAQTPTRDSVAGFAETGSGRGFANFTFDVSSGPSGENPTGTVKLDTFFGVIGPLDVSCLTVSGNKAAMILPAPVGTTSVAGLVVAVQDDGPGQDRIDYHTVATLPDSCPVPSAVSTATVSGDITITDAPPLPTSTRQCRNGGWRSYSSFKSQGDCVSFVVHQAIKACVFEREAIGHRAFRDKYGIGRFGLFAMLRCIHLRADS